MSLGNIGLSTGSLGHIPEIQEEQLSDDHDNEAKNVVKDSTDEESNESVMAYLTLKMIVEMMAMKTDCQIMIL